MRIVAMLVLFYGYDYGYGYFLGYYGWNIF